MNLGAGDVTDVPTYSLFSSGSKLGTIHMAAFFVRDIAPGFVAGLAWLRNGACAPDFFAG
jgi:hypothetical protein